MNAITQQMHADMTKGKLDTYSLGLLLLYFAANDLMRSEQFLFISDSMGLMAPGPPGRAPTPPSAAGLKRS